MFHAAPKANDLASSLKAPSPKYVVTDGARSISLLSGSRYLLLELVSSVVGGVTVVDGAVVALIVSVVPGTAVAFGSAGVSMESTGGDCRTTDSLMALCCLNTFQLLGP